VRALNDKEQGDLPHTLTSYSRFPRLVTGRLTLAQILPRGSWSLTQG